MTRNNETAGEVQPSDRQTNEAPSSVDRASTVDPWAAFWRRLAELFEERAGGRS
jgi:hypothetical protein